MGDFMAMGVFIGIFVLVAVLVFMSMLMFMTMLMLVTLLVSMSLLMNMAITFSLLGRATRLGLSFCSTSSPALLSMHLQEHLSSIFFFLSPLFKFFNKFSQGDLIFWPSDQFCKLTPEFVVGQIFLLGLLFE